MAVNPGIGMSSKMYDLVFVLDATNSNGPVFPVLRDEISDRAHDIHLRFKKVQGRYGVVVYRDPVDSPEDKNEFFQLNPSSEVLADYLDTVNAYGGRDDPEDWVGALQIALNQMAWRETSKKCIFWVTDANAHGPRFSVETRDRHPEEEAKLPPLIEECARRRIYIVVLNIRKMGDPGCQKTASVCREIYLNAGGPSFTIVDYDCGKPDMDLDNWTGEGWSPDAIRGLEATISATLRRDDGIMNVP
jgi:hypothetical protein